MSRKVVCLCFFLFFAVFAGDVAGASWSFPWFGSGKPQVVPFKEYFYNYPQSLPPDYIYRTGRIYPPGYGSLNFWSAADNGSERERDDVSRKAAGTVLEGKIRELGRQLIDNATVDLADGRAVTVSTFVNLNNLYKTSALGRYLGEELINHLQKDGVSVIDVRKTPAIMVMREFGEYSLSRDIDELSFVHPGQAMVVGTYANSAGRIFVSSRILRNSDGMVLSSASLTLELDGVVKGLLADEAVPRRSSAAPVNVINLTD